MLPLRRQAHDPRYRHEFREGLRVRSGVYLGLEAISMRAICAWLHQVHQSILNWKRVISALPKSHCQSIFAFLMKPALAANQGFASAVVSGFLAQNAQVELFGNRDNAANAMCQQYLRGRRR